METRKLAAIMAIDVVGYSRLMGEDEAGTARMVREHRNAVRPLVASRGGRIVKTMGDGLLMEFTSVVDAAGSLAEVLAQAIGFRVPPAPRGGEVLYLLRPGRARSPPGC